MSRSGLDALVEALAAGKVVAVPTDTVYGLAVDPRVTERRWTVCSRSKQRPEHFPLPVLIADPSAAGDLAEVTAAAQRLASRYWPGPLTLVMARRPGVGLDLGGDGATIGLRCPASALRERATAKDRPARRDERQPAPGVALAHRRRGPPALRRRRPRLRRGHVRRPAVDRGIAHRSRDEVPSRGARCPSGSWRRSPQGGDEHARACAPMSLPWQGRRDCGWFRISERSRHGEKPARPHRRALLGRPVELGRRAQPAGAYPAGCPVGWPRSPTLPTVAARFHQNPGSRKAPAGRSPLLSPPRSGRRARHRPRRGRRRPSHALDRGRLRISRRLSCSRGGLLRRRRRRQGG